MKCSKCDEPHDDWPDGDGGKLCQNCWEVSCSDSWWDMIGALGALEQIGLIEVDADGDARLV